MAKEARSRWFPALGLLVLAALIFSGIAPHDRKTWLMEVAPIFIAAPLMLATYRRFPLTSLLYALIAAHALVLSFLRSKGAANFLSACVALAISAFYELVEWWAALALGQGADEFLGTQGDPWDTQSDMFLAMIGAVAALVALSRVHDRQMAEVNRRE